MRIKTEIICGIYKITSPTGRSYIGQAADIFKRWRHYRHKYNKEINKHPKLYNSFAKHGIDNHKFEIIEICTSGCLNEREVFFIYLYDTFNTGLNCTMGGEGTRGYKHTEEQRKNNSEAQLNKPNYDEWLLKLSESHKGQRAWNKGKIGCYKQTDEANQKRREKAVGRKMPKIHGEKVKLAWEKRRLNGTSKSSDKHRENLRISHLGKPSPCKGVSHSPERRKKNSDAQKAAWKRKREISNINIGLWN